MGRWTARLGDEHVCVQCEDSFAHLVPPVLNVLTSLHERGQPMVEGLTLRWGWSALVLVRIEDGRLQAYEPDFDDDPLENVRPDATATLRVQAATRELVSLCRTDPLPVLYDDLVVVAGDVLTSPVLMAQRNPPAEVGDSGWYVGSRPGFEVDPPTPRMVFEMLEHRPALLPALALPAGWQVVVEGDRLSRVVDAQDRDVVRDGRPVP